MIIVGLTGTVASGKNFVASCFKDLGALVWDVDIEVHDILENDARVIADIGQRFPGSLKNNKVDRKFLAKVVFSSKPKLEILESIIHPVTAKRRKEFVGAAKKDNVGLVILNIPLLFEKNIHLECAKNILVKLPIRVQRERFVTREMAKGGGQNREMLIAKFEDILKNQMPDSSKEALADFVIDNDKDEANTLKQVSIIYNQLIK